MLRLIDLHIIKKYFTTFLFILGIVLAICILVDVVEKVDDFIEKQPTWNEIFFDYYINFVFYFGTLFAPVCIFLGVIFFTSRMAERSELVPLIAGGVSFYRILAPYVACSLILSGVSFYLKSYVVPPATAKRIDFEYKYFKKRQVSKTRNIHKKVAPDTFVYIDIYLQKQKAGRGFAMERIVDGEIKTKIHADHIYWIDSSQYWLMRRVEVRHIDGMKEEIRLYPTLDTTFLLTPDDIFIKEQFQESLDLDQLESFIKDEEMRGSDILEDLYCEWHRRFADPVAALILTMIGFAMGSKKSRGGTALRIGFGLIISLMYIGLLFFGQSFAGDNFPPWLAIWMANLIFFPVALILLILSPKNVDNRVVTYWIVGFLVILFAVRYMLKIVLG